MATKRQIWICCKIVVDGSMSEDTHLSLEQLAKEAVPFGGRWDVTYKECLDMLQKPLYKVQD